MRKSVLMIPLLSLWAVTALADSKSKPGDDVAYFTQESKLASQGDAAAEFCEGELYGTGLGVARDAGKQFSLESDAANKGNDAAKLLVAKSYVWGIGVDKDVKKGVDMIQSLVAKGYVPAESALGNLFQAGVGVEKDSMNGIRLLKSAAEADDFEGEVRLGLTYHWGDGVKADPVEAQKWLDKVAKHRTECAADYFFEMPFIINAYVDPNSYGAADPHGKMGIKFSNKDGKAVNIVVFQPSGSHKVDDAWAEAASKAKLPPWPENYQTHDNDKLSGFWIAGSYDGYDPAFTAALKAAVDAAKQFPKDVLLKGSKGDGLATVAFTYQDGAVSDEKITKSSGEPSEDAAAIAAVVDAKYPPTPYQYAHMKMSFTITVSFGAYTPAGPAATAVPTASTK